MEISISLVALGVLTWSEWWLSTPARRPHWYNDVLTLIVLFLAWWFLIVRLVHGEALVGDRQFWITRPYSWYKLLAAKVLFVLGWVATPLAISQALLVSANGVPVTLYLVPIFRDTALAMLVGILPVAALAAITRNLAQWALYGAVLILAVIGIAILGSSFPNSQVLVGSDVAEALQAVAVACLCGAGVLIQYAFRRTFWGTAFVVAAVVSVPVIIIGTPYRRLIDSAYPLISAGPASIRAASGAAERAGIRAIPNENGGAEIIIPVELSVPADGTLATLDAAMISINSPHRRREESEWRPVYTELIEPTPRNVELHFDVNRVAFEGAKAGPAQFQLTLAFSQLKEAARQSVVAYRQFDLPAVGHCWIERDGYTITCRSTEMGPSLLLLSAPDDDSCSPDLPHGVPERCLLSHTKALKSTLGPLSPLTLHEFSLQNRHGSGPGPGGPYPGEKLNFSAPEMVRRLRIELTLGILRFSGQRPIAIVERRRHDFLAGIEVVKGGVLH